jgi:hypothetical protein
MTPVKPSETTPAGSTTNQSRREALKRFARYAAAAPTVAILLQPRDSHADRWRGGRWHRGRWHSKRGWGGGSKRGWGGGSHY